MTAESSIPSENLAGKRALVSGGTRGIGAAVVARLKAAGAHVTAIGRHAVEHPAADEFVPADITTVEGTDKVIEQISGNGGVDIIVHVAGGSGSAPSGGFATLTPELWHRTLQLNLLGAVRVDRGLIPAMIQTGAGSIVHITSIQRKCPSTTRPSPTVQPKPHSRPTAKAWPTNSPRTASASSPSHPASSKAAEPNG